MKSMLCFQRSRPKSSQVMPTYVHGDIANQMMSKGGLAEIFDNWHGPSAHTMVYQIVCNFDW